MIILYAPEPESSFSLRLPFLFMAEKIKQCPHKSFTDHESNMHIKVLYYRLDPENTFSPVHLRLIMTFLLLASFTRTCGIDSIM